VVNTLLTLQSIQNPNEDVTPGRKVDNKLGLLRGSNAENRTRAARYILRMDRCEVGLLCLR